MTASIQSRFRGSLLGLAVGDTLGIHVENQKRDTYEPVVDMTGGRLFPITFRSLV